MVEEICSEMALTRPEAFNEYVIFVVTNRGEWPRELSMLDSSPLLGLYPRGTLHPALKAQGLGPLSPLSSEGPVCVLNTPSPSSVPLCFVLPKFVSSCYKIGGSWSAGTSLESSHCPLGPYSWVPGSMKIQPSGSFYSGKEPKGARIYSCFLQ